MHTLDLWLLFQLGQGLHILKRAALSKSSPLSGTKSIWGYLVTNRVTLLIRAVLVSAGFAYWLTHPDALTTVLARIGFSINLTFAPEHATAVIFGYFADSAMDFLTAKVPMLQKEIPPANGGSAAT